MIKEQATIIIESMKVSLSCVQLFVTPWTVAHQAPLSMEFSRQECWSGLPFTSPNNLKTLCTFSSVGYDWNKWSVVMFLRPI